MHATRVLPASAQAAALSSSGWGTVLSVLGVVLYANYMFGLASLVVWATYLGERSLTRWEVVSLGISVGFYVFWLVVNKKWIMWKPLLWVIGRLATWVTVVALRTSALVVKRPYWTVIDETIILGSLPFDSDVDQLVKLGVTHVVNLCEEYEGPVEAYKRHSIAHLHLPVVDYLPPTLQQIQAGVDMIDQAVRMNKTVYVHCKAGQGRSATVLLCYLVAIKGMTPEEGLKYLRAKRPRVSKDIYRRAVVVKYAALSTQDRSRISKEAQAALATA